MTSPTVGFIGLGAMGEPMAANLLAAGFDVISCANRNREPFERLATAGLREVATPAEVGARADVLMTVVWDEDQNDRILRGPDGALTTLRAGSIVLIMSTVSPGYCRDLAAEAAPSGVTVLDCPVSGMVSGAEAGTLTLMIGGAADDIERCRPALEPLGTVAHCGDVGMGQIMKLANNAMAVGTFGLLQETRELVAKHGMNPDTFMDYLNRSTGRSYVSETWPMPADRVPLTPIREKDLTRCLAAAADADAWMPMISRYVAVGTGAETRTQEAS